MTALTPKSDDLEEGVGPESKRNVIRAGFGNRDQLRTFIKQRYGASPPKLVWVSGIPSEDGGGVRYDYDDGSQVIASAGFLWYGSDGNTPPDGEWDPVR